MIKSSTELRTDFLNYLNANPYRKEPLGLYEPVDYILQIGGKRVRPVLALLAGQLFDAAPEVTLPVAQAVEVFHNFTLLHDDIMDESDLRRGQLTVHKKWDVNTGILSGDLMLIKAYEQLCLCPTAHRIPEMLCVFNEVATGVCEGQQYDVDFETRSDVSIQEYIRMIELKTAVLLGGALQLGALAADAPAEDAQHLYEFGRLTGIAFQLQDDLLDTFGTTEQIGKQVGNDIVRNKKTFLYLRALEIAETLQKESLLGWFGLTPDNPTQKVAEVTGMMREMGIPEEVAKLRDQYQLEAYEHLNAVQVKKEKKQALIDLTESLLLRSS
ncbi:polyprenyl synthetase [Lewinellaceae bacterium SD302]|nr:polyprenyl synthetase [Lewinellaceae bacterium SD302]